MQRIAALPAIASPEAQSTSLPSVKRVISKGVLFGSSNVTNGDATNHEQAKQLECFHALRATKRLTSINRQYPQFEELKVFGCYLMTFVQHAYSPQKALNIIVEHSLNMHIRRNATK
ncbi:hypothetical protein GN244_ATG00953 [Phytophthora infestans]|uniref:Uncharacterized protein n=1 Tax=Phytophthora infestans TaxID=4787 RepID=A0A833WMZ2_PHYIN|nr:hypothetical protein GN244_ATG00953 [Phytophthora infestans]